MMTYTTVEDAVKLVVDILEANMITEQNDFIRARVYSWYNHSDVTDPEILAACALEGKDWFPGATYQYMLNAKNFWFPVSPFDEISIWEIEDAEHDAMWW